MFPIVLILCIDVYGGCSPATMEFLSAEACNKARYEIWQDAQERNGIQLVYSKCIDKRTGETVSTNQ